MNTRLSGTPPVHLRLRGPDILPPYTLLVRCAALSSSYRCLALSPPPPFSRALRFPPENPRGRAPPLARNEEELVDVTRALSQEGEEEEEEAHLFGGEQGGGGRGHVVGKMRRGGGLAPTATPSSPAGGATLCVRDMAIAMWRGESYLCVCHAELVMKIGASALSGSRRTFVRRKVVD